MQKQGASIGSAKSAATSSVSGVSSPRRNGPLSSANNNNNRSAVSASSLRVPATTVGPMLRPTTAVASRRGGRGVGGAALLSRGWRELSVEGSSVDAASTPLASAPEDEVAEANASIDEDAGAGGDGEEVEEAEEDVLESRTEGRSPSMTGSHGDRARSLEKGESSPDEYSPDSNETPSPTPNQLRAWKQADLDDYR